MRDMSVLSKCHEYVAKMPVENYQNFKELIEVFASRDGAEILE